MTVACSYAKRIVAVVTTCVNDGPASYTQWAADLANLDLSAPLWDALAYTSGVNDELNSRVKREALGMIARRASREFNDTIAAVQAADRRLAAEANR